ncbi:MAG: DUF1987 domain-containing protein [Bacteroidales bacterium]|nr:DUF1987 domain-containing protein [Bacteroidales bacterium]
MDTSLLQIILLSMDNEWIQKNKISVFELFDLLNEEKVEYIYRGKFDSKITDGILSLAEINLDTTDSVKIKKRVYFILVEGLQNITRHQEQANEIDDFNEGFLAIQKKDTEYAITTGNLIQNTTIADLSSQLDKINSLSKDDLKTFYRQILDNETFSQKGGAGLGLIEIARKSGSKIAYDFQEVSDNHSYFYMHTKISLAADTAEYEVQSLANMKIIHKFFAEQDILINVTGIFNHEKLIYLLSILESHMSKQVVLKNKMFSVMIELMQNVVKHADDIEINNVMGKHSVFFITSNDNEISINSGNYILTKKVKKLKQHIDKINNMSHNELNKFHFDTLVNYKTEKEISYGLGLLDMRLKSRNPIFYTFQEIDDTNSFFSIRISLNHEIQRKRVLQISPKDTTPKIILDEKNGQFTFCGNSYPENANEFYKPIINWITKYSESPRLFTLFEFKFNILSTSSQKELIKILKSIEKTAESSAVVVRWYYNKKDEDSLTFGMEFSQLFNIDFKLVEFDNAPC